MKETDEENNKNKKNTERQTSENETFGGKPIKYLGRFLSVVIILIIFCTVAVILSYAYKIYFSDDNIQEPPSDKAAAGDMDALATEGIGDRDASAAERSGDTDISVTEGSEDEQSGDSGALAKDESGEDKSGSQSSDYNNKSLDTGKEKKSGKAKVIVIDPGHQSKADISKEPIGPGSKTYTMKISGGTSGTSTGIPEYKITLVIGKKLKKSLESEGYNVYMVRKKHDVNISNSDRALYANKKNADLYVRLHCDGVADGGKERGFLTLIPKENEWTKDISEESKNAAKIIHKTVLKETGARDRGIIPRGDLSGFNYCNRPCILFEMGVMTNKDDDILLSTDEYHDKLVSGITKGLNNFFSNAA